MYIFVRVLMYSYISILAFIHVGFSMGLYGDSEKQSLDSNHTQIGAFIIICTIYLSNCFYPLNQFCQQQKDKERSLTGDRMGVEGEESAAVNLSVESLNAEDKRTMTVIYQYCTLKISHASSWPLLSSGSSTC